MTASNTKRVTAGFASCALGLALLGAAAAAHAFTGEKYAKQAKITLAEARAIALRTFPGKIADEELERERGGSGLRYSFDIVSGRVRQEVGVDAKTGKILENDREGPNAD